MPGSRQQTPSGSIAQSHIRTIVAALSLLMALMLAVMVWISLPTSPAGSYTPQIDNHPRESSSDAPKSDPGPSSSKPAAGPTTPKSVTADGRYEL